MLKLSSGEEHVARCSVSGFVQSTSQLDRGQGTFELESDRILGINLNGRVWTQTGSMVAYRGNVRFEREGVMEHGLGKMLKRAVTGEGTKLTKAEGTGKIYLADYGKKISILNLQSESIFVNGNDLLAFEETVQWDIRMMRKVAAMMSGGLFSVELKGTGMIALTTYYDPLTLVVTPDSPVITDPNATVTWSGDLAPEFKTDVSLKTFFGRGSGEPIQMLFRGDGFVVIQPYEEASFQSSSSGGGQ